jgi:hypothetical protein
MRYVLNGLSAITIALVGIMIVGITISYNNFIQGPLQGGWNLYRLHEFGLQIAPFTLLFLGLLITRLRGCPRWLFFTCMTLVLLLSGWLILFWINMAFATKHFAGLIQPIVFLILLSSHLFFISRLRQA